MGRFLIATTASVNVEELAKRSQTGPPLGVKTSLIDFKSQMFLPLPGELSITSPG